MGWISTCTTNSVKLCKLTVKRYCIQRHNVEAYGRLKMHMLSTCILGGFALSAPCYGHVYTRGTLLSAGGQWTNHFTALNISSQEVLRWIFQIFYFAGILDFFGRKMNIIMNENFIRMNILSIICRKNSVAWVPSELYRLSERWLSAKLVPNFADRGVPCGQREGSPTAVFSMI
jgi:hypothetical protein